MARKRSAFAVYKEIESTLEEDHTTNDLPEEGDYPMERKRRGRKKEAAVEDTSKPVKRRGRSRKKAPSEEVDSFVMSSEPEPTPTVPEKKQKKETKPRGRGKKKTPVPAAEPPAVEPPAPPEAPPPQEPVPFEDSETIQNSKQGASAKKRKKLEQSRRKTYAVVADTPVPDEGGPVGHVVKTEPNVDLAVAPMALNTTVVKAPPKPTIQRKRPVPNMGQSPGLVDKQTAPTPDTDQGKGAKSPKKAKRAVMGSPRPAQIKAAHTMEQPISGVPFMNLFESICFDDSREAAREMFRMLIHPVSEEHFLSANWEKKPMYLKRNSRYNEGVFSTAELDRILRENDLQFTVNVDVTSYKGGVRETHNPVGRAHPYLVWDYYKSGCSVRVLNPQTYSHGLWQVNSILQEYFHSCVGSNIYLTPPGTQGFAPHYDDIEAFVLQLEGRKRWRLYKPRSTNETLPLESSPNFTDRDIGEPILDVILQPGDMLYFPRGTIHQAQSLKDTHSLHVTLSTYQRNTWGDYLQKLLNTALPSALEEDVAFREGLPLSYLNYTGLANVDSTDPRRDMFVKKLEALLDRLKQFISVDQTTDEMATDYLHCCLPPCLSNKEAAQCVSGVGHTWDAERRTVARSTPLELTTHVKLVRHGAIRIMGGTDSAVLVYTTNNGRTYQERDIQAQDLTFPQAEAVDHLLRAYPSFVTLEELPLRTTEEKIQLAEDLLSKQLLLLKQPDP